MHENGRIIIWKPCKKQRRNDQRQEHLKGFQPNQLLLPTTPGFRRSFNGHLLQTGEQIQAPNLIQICHLRHLQRYLQRFQRSMEQKMFLGQLSPLIVERRIDKEALPLCCETFPGEMGTNIYSTYTGYQWPTKETVLPSNDSMSLTQIVYSQSGNRIRS